jgi:actin-related protein
MIADSIMRTDLDFQTVRHRRVTFQELFGHIVMCGGTSMMKGFQERIYNEILNIKPNHISREELNLPLDSFRRYSAWIGGSMIGSLSTFQKFCIF